MSVSQPSWPGLQSPKPASHTKLQAPLVHEPVALGAVQSVSTQHWAFATQFPLQQIPALAPVPHLPPWLTGACAQVPALQLSLVHGLLSLQLLLQVPQLVVVVLGTQAPLQQIPTLAPVPHEALF
jgi:hypothetical protein